MKKYLKQSLLLFILVLLLGVIGCDNSAKNDDNSDYYSTNSISGVISTTAGGDSAAGLHTENVDPSDYMIWFQNRGSKRVYFVDIAEGGSFELDVETMDGTLGKNFFAAIVKKDPLEFAGTILFSSESNTEASNGIKVDGNITNFDVNFDPDAYKALIDCDDELLTKNAEQKVRLNQTTGMPVGANNVGKGTDSKTSNLNTDNPIDKDQDGMPDIFDAMNNGADLDNENADNRFDSVKGSDSISSAIMFMNLKIDEENASTYTITDNAVIVLELQAKNASKISSVKAHLLHTNFKNSTLDRLPSSFTAIDTYPAENSNWSADSYNLYKVQDQDGSYRWTVLIKPQNNTFAPGNLVLLKVSLKDGTYEYYWLTINFKFQSIATCTNTWTLGGSGKRSDPYVIADTGAQSFTWTHPKDELGNDLAGLNYQFEIFYMNEDGNQGTPEVTVGERNVITIGTNATSGTITSANIDKYIAENPSPNFIQVDITASYPYGDNSALKVYLKRDSWELNAIQ
jgi:hypothetical protein